MSHDHQIFVRLYDANFYPAFEVRISALRWRHCAGSSKRIPRKSKPSQMRLRTARCMLSDSSRKNEQVQSAQNCGICSDVFLRSVAEEIHSFFGPRVRLHFVQQNPHVPGLGRNSQQVRIFYSRIVSSSFATTFFCSRRYSKAPGSTSPERVLITSPSSGVKPMDVSTLFPSLTATMLAPLPR